MQLRRQWQLSCSFICRLDISSTKFWWSPERSKVTMIKCSSMWLEKLYWMTIFLPNVFQALCCRSLILNLVVLSIEGGQPRTRILPVSSFLQWKPPAVRKVISTNLSHKSCILETIQSLACCSHFSHQLILDTKDKQGGLKVATL